jgi:hypothetical protein
MSKLTRTTWIAIAVVVAAIVGAIVAALSGAGSRDDVRGSHVQTTASTQTTASAQSPAPVQTTASVLATPLSFVGKYYFVPNQDVSASWHPLNGHVEGSFSDFALWPALITHLLKNSGGFGFYSNEIAATPNATLAALRTKGLLISVDTPLWTQCAPASQIADAELNGTDNPMSKRFGIVGTGWFVTKDGTPFTPDEIVLDEREPTLVPYPRGGGLPNDGCAAADTFNASLSRTDGMIQDFVTYANTVRTKWPTNTPHLSFYWNLNPVFAEQSSLLDKLVSTMCAATVCPAAVYMDTDFAATPNLVSVLKAYKVILDKYGVGFGIAIAGTPHSEVGHEYDIEPTADGRALIYVAHPGTSSNQLYQLSELNILKWLMAQGIVDGNTRLHLQSWTSSPQEVGPAVSETTPHSLAHTTNRMFDELLIPKALAK